MRFSSKVQESDSIIDVGVLCIVEDIHPAKASRPLLAPSVGHAVMHVGGDPAVEMIYVKLIQSLLKPISLPSQAADRLYALPVLVTVRFANRPLDQRENLVVHVQAGELLRESLGQGFFAHIFLGTFLLEAGAVVINVPTPLHLGDHRAAAVAASDQTCESEPQRLSPHIARAPGIKDLLDVLPGYPSHERLVCSLIQASAPLKGTCVQSVPKHVMNRAGPDGFLAPTVPQPGGPRFVGDIFQGVVTRFEPFEHTRHDGSKIRVRDDDFFALWANDVEVAEGSLRRPDTLLRLLEHALASFLGEVINIVLSHEDLDPMHELFGGTRVAGENRSFLYEVQFDVESIERHPILDVAIEPIRLFHQQMPHPWMTPKIFQHRLELGTTCLFCGFHINILLGDDEAHPLSIFADQSNLGVDGEAFPLLLRRRDASI